MPKKVQVPWPVTDDCTAIGGIDGTLKWQITQKIDRGIVDVRVTPNTVELMHEYSQLTVQSGDGTVRHYAIPTDPTIVRVAVGDHELRALLNIKQTVDAWLVAAARAQHAAAPPTTPRPRSRRKRQQ